MSANGEIAAAVSNSHAIHWDTYCGSSFVSGPGSRTMQPPDPCVFGASVPLLRLCSPLRPYAGQCAGLQKGTGEAAVLC